MKILSSVESLNSFFEWLSVGLIALTFIAGAGTVITSRIINARQGRDIFDLKKLASDSLTKQQRVELELEKQREKTALAERAALDTQRFIKEPRTLNRKLGEQLLATAPKGRASFVYVDAHEDAEFLATDLYSIMGSSGWRVRLPEMGTGIPINGITIRTRSLDGPDGDIPEPGKSLRKFLVEAVNGNTYVGFRADHKLEADEVVIVIGPKY